jgi:hypothetical protein
MKFKRNDVTISGRGVLSMSYDLAEHELFLSFNDDDQAIVFEEWLYETGLDKFAKYYEGRV